MQASVARGRGHGGGGDVRLLADRIRDILARGSAPGEGSVVPTGWAGVDDALAGGGLSRGAIHEWLGVGDRPWSPPISLLAHLAWQALESAGERNRRVLWIGRRVWPYPRALIRDLGLRTTAVSPPAPSTCASSAAPSLHTEELELARLPREERPGDASLLLSRSLLVDASRCRLWAIDAALRCTSVAAVVADASGLDMTASRRLQLAAEAGESFGLLARPSQEERELSAAATRWRVCRPRPRDAVARPRWTLKLLRCKGVRGGIWKWRA